MTENKYSVELISGLAPKNNGSFPIIQAKDVEMPDGTRLSDFKGSGIITETAVMPDWSVNDPNTPGYIKNRTHWEETFPVVGWDDRTDGKEFFDASSVGFSVFYKISDEFLTKDVLKTASVAIALSDGNTLNLPYHSTLYTADFGVVTEYADEEMANSIVLCSAYEAVDLTEELGIAVTSPGLYVIFEYQNTDRSYSLEIPPVFHKIKKEFLPDDIVLPKVTTDDNNKIMQVVDGMWTQVSLADSAIKTYIDDYISSALGGDY